MLLGPVLASQPQAQSCCLLLHACKPVQGHQHAIFFWPPPLGRSCSQFTLPTVLCFPQSSWCRQANQLLLWLFFFSFDTPGLLNCVPASFVCTNKVASRLASALSPALGPRHPCLAHLTFPLSWDCRDGTCDSPKASLLPTGTATRSSGRVLVWS